MARRNAQGSGNIKHREDGRWEARYYINNPTTGKPTRKSVYGKTQKEVRQKLTSILAEVDDTGTHFEPSRFILSEWLDIWLADYMGDKKYLTVKHYKAQVNTHIRPALGGMKLAALVPHDIQRFYNKLLKEGRTVKVKDKNGKIKTEHKPLSAKSVRNIHGILTKCLSTALKLGYIKVNPCDATTLPRSERKEIQPLTDEQVKEFLVAVNDDEYAILLKLILLTGLRESEAMGLTWDCVDFKTGTLTINKQLQKRPKDAGGFQFAPLKNDKTRLLAPAPLVMELLEERRRMQLEEHKLAGDEWQAWSNIREQAKALVFTNKKGQNLSPQTVYNHFKKTAFKIGAPDACVHDLRHTYATLSIANGDDIKTVQDNLGHATAAFTLDVYGHPTERAKRESANRMQNYIASLNAKQA